MLWLLTKEVGKQSYKTQLLPLASNMNFTLFASKLVEDRILYYLLAAFTLYPSSHTRYKSLQRILSSFRKRSWKYNILYNTS